MTKIEAIIRPNKFDSVKAALIELGVEGMTVSEVRGHGRQKGHTEVFRGREYDVDLLPKVKVELVLNDDGVEKAIDAILSTPTPGRSVTERSSFTNWMTQFEFEARSAASLPSDTSPKTPASPPQVVAHSLGGAFLTGCATIAITPKTRSKRCRNSWVTIHICRTDADRNLRREDCFDSFLRRRQTGIVPSRISMHHRYILVRVRLPVLVV